MKKWLFLTGTILTIWGGAQGQLRKLRPDAMPLKAEVLAEERKSSEVATTMEQMSAWDRYPSYGVYLSMMQHWEETYPALCHIDTIGISIEGRYILSAELSASSADDIVVPEFFYSSTIHGDELTGYVMLLRLIDTLLKGYGNNIEYTQLLNTTRICINPLSNPDGTYSGGDNDIRLASRYNADYYDLNRNFPNPFVATKDPLQPENAAMIAYVERHHFRLSANLHGGSEVMNYPWDCFSSMQLPHPASQWWQQVCSRFVDTARSFAPDRFSDVCSNGYIAGGDWYIISGGRQDYMNYYHHCLELTMEISTTKIPEASTLPYYWHYLQHSLVNYINEIYTLPDSFSIETIVKDTGELTVFPNPSKDCFMLSRPLSRGAWLCDLEGRRILYLANGTQFIDASHLPYGLYVLPFEEKTLKLQVVQK